jgi:hypothetical protein
MAQIKATLPVATKLARGINSSSLIHSIPPEVITWEAEVPSTTWKLKHQHNLKLKHKHQAQPGSTSTSTSTT